MIKTFAHKGLQKYAETGNAAGINPNHRSKITRILTALEAAEIIEDMELPGFRLHKLTGNWRGFWSVEVSGNYRIIFRFENSNAYEVNYLDYH